MKHGGEKGCWGAVSLVGSLLLSFINGWEQEQVISCQPAGCWGYHLSCRVARHFAGHLSFLGEQAAEEPVRFNGSEHQVVPFAGKVLFPSGNEPTRSAMAFCEGSGLLWRVWLHPSG